MHTLVNHSRTFKVKMCTPLVPCKARLHHRGRSMHTYILADVNSHKVQARNKTASQENILSATNIRIVEGGHQTYTACI